jgi:hypothetical protein
LVLCVGPPTDFENENDDEIGSVRETNRMMSSMTDGGVFRGSVDFWISFHHATSPTRTS